MRAKRKEEPSEYDLQAVEFLKDSATTCTIEYLKHDKHFEGDKETRDIYEVTLERGGRSYSFNFGQSIMASGKWAIFSKLTGKINRRSETRIFLGEGLTKSGEKAFKYLAKANREARTSTRPLFRDKPECADIKRNPDFEAPSEYDVLTCLTTNDPGLFEDFCGDFGYDEDSRTAEKTYNAVREEFLNLERLFTPTQMEQLSEIQ